MSRGEVIHELSMLGGPLHRLSVRLGLAHGTTTIGLGLVLGLLPWGVLVTLALAEGRGSNLHSLVAVGVHVRFLVAVPLFFMCETWVIPQMAEFARSIVRSGVAPDESLSELNFVIGRVNRLSSSRVAESLLLAAAIVLPMVERFSSLPGTTSSWASVIRASGGELSGMQGWYLGFCLPLFRFLLARWLWRLGLWCYFLWRIEKLPLRLIPIHSDRVAGLGYLEIVHEQFLPLAFAFSAVLYAQCAEAIALGTMAFETLFYVVVVIAFLIAAMFAGPLLVFYRKLWICRAAGMSEYMSMASRYAIAFEERWIRDEDASGVSQLGSPDLQSLADLTNSVNVVRNMRWIPAGRRLVLELASCVAIPLLPVLLLKYPVDELALRLFRAVAGL